MKAKPERGTQDELEILKQILEKDPILRETVLEKMRYIRLKGRQSLADVVKEKEDANAASANAQRQNFVR